MPIPNTKVFLGSTILAGGGFKLNPEASGDFAPTLTTLSAPSWLASVGDLNGDGIAEIAVGAPGDDDKANNAGRVFITMSTFAPGSTTGVGSVAANSIIMDGISAGDLAGFSIAGLADMNGDGLGELLVGSPGKDVTTNADAGAAFVIWGSALSAGIDLGNPFASDGKGYAIKGETAGDAAGYSVVSLGDLNGDGITDALVGAPGQDAGGIDAGAAYVVFGKTSKSAVSLANVAAGTGGFKIIGAHAGDAIGSAMASLGDQNGDARAEILIGVRGDTSGGTNAGAVYVVDGKATGTAVDLNDVALGIGGYKITGVAQDEAGAAVGNAGDINGDGLDDIIIGAPHSNSAYVVFGKNNHTNVDLADVRNGVGGFRILAEAAGDLDKMVVLGNVDLNRDGQDDLVIGASKNAEGGLNAGAVYVVWGGGSAGTVDLNLIAQGFGGAKVVGSAQSRLGSSVAVGSDYNGDGVADLIMGAPGVGESVQVLYTPTSWQPDLNIYGTAGADVMESGYGAAHKIGAGDDFIMGLGGADSINGAAGNDSIEGGTGADTLIGDTGNDSLDGGTGGDRMVGGTGDDVYFVDDAADVVVEAAGEGDDTVSSLITYTLTNNVERLTLTAAGRTGTGNGLDNTLTGTSGADTLDGAGGADTMTGGAGNDTYVVDSLSDVVNEALNGGTDRVTSYIDYTLGAFVENLTLLGSARVGTGNALSNALVGTAGNDTLDGLAGADTMTGGTGDDTYFVDNIADVVVEAAGGGRDQIRSSVSYTLSASVEDLVLLGTATSGTGNGLDNTITGTDLANTLNGGLGADTMIGGAGDDTYIVDNAGDVIVELAGGGNDTVMASLDYTLTDGAIENLTLTGAARHGTGNAGANRLVGTGFADTLDGAGGADTMIGGAGDDTYIVDSASDVITELAGGGHDHVQSSVSYTLGAEVEDLTLTTPGTSGTGNGLANHLIGASGSESLFGMDGEDTLDGGAGADYMEGGAGNDTYILDDLSDVAVEGVDGGIDTAVVMIDGITVGANIENIRLAGSAHLAIGGAGANRLSGAEGDDDLDGGEGDDLLLGGDGNDHLRAHSGHDTLAGGSGDDTYHISGASVEIEDYLGHDTLDASDSAGNDHIDLSGETETEIEGHIIHITPGGTTSAPLDVQFLQDRSGSFADDIANVRGLVPQIVAALQTVQANSKFGVSSFIDKPVSPFGATGEWVYQQHLGLTSDSAALSSTYTAMSTLSGADGPEAQIEGLMQLALHAAEVGFRPDSARFVVLFTDAPFHIAGDGAAGGILTPNNGDALFPGNGAMEDYPTVAQVRYALEVANIIPIFAIAGGYETTYAGLATELGRGAVVSLTANSSNIVAAITAGMTTATTTHIEDAIGGGGDDNLLGGVEDNGLYGGAGNDHIEGRHGADHLEGGEGDDDLFGGEGDDDLIGGIGSDTAHFSGARADYTVAAVAGGIVVTDTRALMDGTDTLHEVELIAFSDRTYTAAELTFVPSKVVVDLTINADIYVAPTNDHYKIRGLDGRDTITTGDGNDTISGNKGGDSMFSGDGDDVFQVGLGSGFDAFDGGAGTDTILATGKKVAIGIASITDVEVISANGFAKVSIAGNKAGNLLDFSGTTLDGIMSINGGKGADTIFGSVGSDVIIGSKGADVMTGGDGADVFVFKSINDNSRTVLDIITDFTQGSDVLDFSAIDLDPLTTGRQGFTFIGSDPFNNVAGELRAVTRASGVVMISGDIDGDGVADMQVRLEDFVGHSGPMLLSDFLL